MARRVTRAKNVKLNVVVDPEAPAKGGKPDTHPKYWAAFILIGDPHRRLNDGGRQDRDRRRHPRRPE